MKILIVDDEIDFLHAVQGVLEDEGYETLAAGSGPQALDLLRADPPALVLLDYMMPVMNGAEVFQAIRAMDSLKDTPVVLMSAIHPGDESLRRSFRAFLHKPFPVPVLLETVAKLIGQPGAAKAAEEQA
jgi:CheY-like chemotaxis protein